MWLPSWTVQCDSVTSSPVNIRNVLKCFKHIFRMLTKPQTCFINIMYTNVFTENVYKITQEARFDWRHFLKHL